MNKLTNRAKTRSKPKNPHSSMMDRAQTCQYITSILDSGKPAVVSRYADGEYYLMTRQMGEVGSGKEKRWLSKHLIRAIKKTGQLVCINEIKHRNQVQKDVWYKSHHYLMKVGKHSLYGSANWNVYDYHNESDVLHRFFTNRVLIIGGYAEQCKDVFGNRMDLTAYSTPCLQASERLEKTTSDIMGLVKKNKYDNIILSCGKMGKLLLVDLKEKTSANIIDMGAVLNAIIAPYIDEGNKIISNWGMSWAKLNKHQANMPLLKEKSAIFWKKVDDENSL